MPMAFLITILPWLQIILAILLSGSILLQQSEAGLGGTFGGDSSSNPFTTKRGFEKMLFRITIILAILFVLSTILSSYLKI